MEAHLHRAASHSSHDDQWCIVSADCHLPLCIACLVEHLEDQSLTRVQKQFKLSLLSTTVEENEEALQLFRENPLVCQHVLELMTDYYSGESFATDAVQVCVQLLHALQSEELYIYLLDKFEHQVETSSGIYPFVVHLLSKLSGVSTAYVLTLIQTHERLLFLLLETHNSSTVVHDAVSCNVLFLMIRLMDIEVLPMVKPSMLSLTQCCMLQCLTSARSEDVYLNAAALLKCLLRTDGCLAVDTECWAELILGLKRLFVSKKQALVTAASQCLLLIASLSRHGPLLRLVLDGDLCEFLFEALHTTNGAQLETVFKCLLMFSDHEQFYKKCHAMYGLESILRSLDALLVTQNVQVLGKGFTLLSNLLQRQPSNIPMLVNVNVTELMMSVVAKGVRCHAVQVVVPAASAATALFKDGKVNRHQQFCHYYHTIMEAALTQMTRQMWPSAGSSETAVSCTLSTELSGDLPLTPLKLLTVYLGLLTSAVLTVQKEDQDVEKSLLEICRDKIVPFFRDHFASCDDSALGTMFDFFNTLYSTREDKMPEISDKVLTSGLVVQVLLKKPDFRSDLELLSSASSFTENVFSAMLTEDLTQCHTVPDYLTSGLRQLSLRSSLRQTVSELWNADTAAALCMLLYFSCLNKLDVCSPIQVAQVVCQLHEKGLLLCTPQRPLTTKFLLYLLAFANSSKEATADPSLQNVEQMVVQLAADSDLSVDYWATPHPHVFVWVFESPLRAKQLGTALVEHWLLHTKGNIPTEVDDSQQDQCHIVFTLFLNPNFRMVLFNLMLSSSQEISVLSKKLFVTLTGSNLGRTEEESYQLIRVIQNEVMTQFQRLFVLSVRPSRHVVNSYFQAIISVLQHPMCQPSETDHNTYIGVVHHLAHYIGNADSEDSELLNNGMTTLDCLSATTDEEQDRAVVPILLQNVGFVQQLEKCLHCKEHSSVALSVLTWISCSSSDCETDYLITVRTDFIIHTVSLSTSRAILAALRILYLSLRPDLACPLSFQPSAHSLHHQQGLLYTAQHLRQLVAYVQQHVCSEDRRLQLSAVKCYLELLRYSRQLDTALGDHLLNHPWNPLVLLCVLTNAAVTGLDPDTAELVHLLWCDEDNDRHAEVARLALESVLVTEVTPENHDLLQLLVHKAKSNCQDQDLREQVALKLAEFENSLTFSQNTLKST